MSQTSQFKKPPHPTSDAGPVYEVFVTTSEDQLVELQLREVIAHKRGDLRALCRVAPPHPNRMHLRLGARRLHDVLAALEGAGFEVTAVVMPGEQPASHGGDAVALRESRLE